MCTRRSFFSRSRGGGGDFLTGAGLLFAQSTIWWLSRAHCDQPDFASMWRHGSPQPFKFKILLSTYCGSVRYGDSHSKIFVFKIDGGRGYPLIGASFLFGGGVHQVQQRNLLLRREERRLKGIARHFVQLVVGETKSVLCQQVFVNQRSAEHGGIVGVQRNHESVIEIGAQRVLLDRSAAARPQIAGQADFDRNLPLCQFGHQFRILTGAQSMANAFCTQVQSAPNRFGAGILTGVCCKPKTVCAGIGVHVAKKLGWASALVTTNAESGHIAVAVPHRQLRYFAAPLRAKMTDGVENPEQRNTEVAFPALP